MLNFFSVIIYGYFLLAGVLIFFIWRDGRRPEVFLFRHPRQRQIITGILILGIFCAFDAYFVEPWTIKTTNVNLPIKNITTPLKIAFVSDIQIGNHKKSEWVKKITENILVAKPDIVILGGDQIDNEGNTEDESAYLEPLRAIAAKYPTFAVMGNHEYGIGNDTRAEPKWQTGDRSDEVVARLKNIGVKLLRNELNCLEIKQQALCLYGVDDLWAGRMRFDQLMSWNEETPLVFITHNPDGILRWPKNVRLPDLTLAGHTHGGQVWLPLIGPLGDAGIELPNKYYRGLNDYNNSPIFTSVGVGESGGAVRFGDLPEAVIIKI